jgi:DNA-binding response OmpR family regulator
MPSKVADSVPASPGLDRRDFRGAEGQISILLIESDGPVRRDLAGALELAGCSVISGAALPVDPDGIGSVDVARVDVGGIPDGWARLTSLRRIIPSLDIVVMSVDRGDRDRSREMGFATFVEMPFGLGELMEVLRAAVGDKMPVSPS